MDTISIESHPEPDEAKARSPVKHVRSEKVRAASLLYNFGIFDVAKMRTVYSFEPLGKLEHAVAELCILSEDERADPPPHSTFLLHWKAVWGICVYINDDFSTGGTATGGKGGVDEKKKEASLALCLLSKAPLIPTAIRVLDTLKARLTLALQLRPRPTWDAESGVLPDDVYELLRCCATLPLPSPGSRFDTAALQQRDGKNLVLDDSSLRIIDGDADAVVDAARSGQPRPPPPPLSASAIETITALVVDAPPRRSDADEVFAFGCHFLPAPSAVVRAIHAIMLGASRVVVIGTRRDAVAAATAALEAMLRPLRWQGVLAPLLSRSLLPLLTAPVPVMCGALKSDWDRFAAAEGRVTVDVVLDIDSDIVGDGDGAGDGGGDDASITLERSVAELLARLSMPHHSRLLATTAALLGRGESGAAAAAAVAAASAAAASSVSASATATVAPSSDTSELNADRGGVELRGTTEPVDARIARALAHISMNDALREQFTAVLTAASATNTPWGSRRGSLRSNNAAAEARVDPAALRSLRELVHEIVQKAGLVGAAAKAQRPFLQKLRLTQMFVQLEMWELLGTKKFRGRACSAGSMSLLGIPADSPALLRSEEKKKQKKPSNAERADHLWGSSSSRSEISKLKRLGQYLSGARRVERSKLDSQIGLELDRLASLKQAAAEAFEEGNLSKSEYDHIIGVRNKAFVEWLSRVDDDRVEQ